MKNKTYFTIVWAIIFLTLISAILIQSHMFIGWDMSWFLLITQRLLDGGNYVTSFMDINPPILMYTLIPTVLLSKLTGISLILSFRISIFLLAILSLLTCASIIKKLYHQKERLIQAFLLIALSICFFLLPTYEFGHNTALFILLTMSYFFRIAALANGIPVSRLTSIWIGILAGIGFLTDIQLITLFFASEIFLAIKQKKITINFRVDSALILLILIAYIASVFLLTPAYIKVILPLVFFLFIKIFNMGWEPMFLNTAFITWLATAILFPFHLKSSKQKALVIILFIAATGTIINFLATLKLWYYYMLPPLTFSLILLTLYLANDLYIIRYAKDMTINREWKILVKCIIVFSLLILLPLKLIFTYTEGGLNYRSDPSNQMNQLIRYTKQKAKGKTIYVFSTTVAPGTTLVDYADVKLGSRFADFWMLPRIVLLSKEKLNPEKTKKLKKAKTLLNNIVVADFQKYKPKLVFVDVSKYKGYFQNIQFNYVTYFSKDPRFKKIWSHYHKINHIGSYAIYQRGK